MMKVDFEKGNGLVPAIVQDAISGEVLMLGYMNEESLRKTFETGLATYWSRSRNELWTKGETSGHYQHVQEIRIDCDEDTLLIKVIQDGAACHTGNRSCFYRLLEDTMSELRKQYETAVDRKNNPEEGSYTTYLFNKGLEKILKKVGEESTEVIIASLNGSKEELVGEINDLIYHVLVLMVEKGITLEDVEAEMVRRSQKQHNLKAERKPITNL